jgi:ABC-2 type transport system ATP-binding protein
MLFSRTPTQPTARPGATTDGRAAEELIAVEVAGLVKRFRGRCVVDELSFSVRRGELFALVGPNGAGKTTTVETLEGYHAPDEGRVRVLGQDPRRGGRALRSRIGVMLQDGGLYPALRPPEILSLFASYYEAPLDPESLLRAFGLTPSRRTPYRRLSGGERQRLSLAAAIIGRPEVLFLDEPTAGMDPQARQHTWSIIREQQARGVTVLLTTHHMDEVERLADRVAVINRGRLLALDTPAGLRRAGAAGTRTLRLRAHDGLQPEALDGLRTVQNVRADGSGGLLAETDIPAEALVELTRWARDAGVALTQLTVGDTSLEDAYLRLIGGDGEERPA